MGTGSFTDDFKRNAVARIAERSYPAKDDSERFGVSTHSLCIWKRKFVKAVSGDTEKDAEIRRLKRELTRVARPAWQSTRVTRRRSRSMQRI